MTTAPAKPLYRKVIGPRLKPLLFVVFGLFALLAINSVYLLGVRLLEAASGRVYQNWFYLNMFLVHLVLGLLIVLPVVAFGLGHLRNAYNRPNRRAVRVGYGLLVTALLLLASGVVLMRVEGLLEVKDPAVRSVAYWLHVLLPFVAAWLFVLHRLAGKAINWRVGGRWAIAAGVFGVVMLVWQAQDPRRWNQAGPASGERYFFPSLARTASGNFIPARVLQNDAYCQECHPDVYRGWEHSVHRFSSFNNPPYLFSVRETRKVSLARDGDVQAARFCAGCHDPVVFFSGRFDDPNFDDVRDPTAHAGITCTSCHAISHLNSVRGNADYTIDEPVHYPFAFAEARLLRTINRQLVKAKPDFHKQTFLKPLHRSEEFCGSCHKVHLPPELNGYKWLRGQNHYDSFLLSGVSGHGVASFYYPQQAEENCAGCHMPLEKSNDFGAKRHDQSGALTIRGHLFPSANTAIPRLVGLPEWVIERHREFNRGVVRVDLFGIKPGGTIGDPLVAPLRPQVPELEPGRAYLLEAVVRTLKMGHELTQGTADSNELWLDVTMRDGERVIGRSGGVDERGEVDPWSHFVTVYMLDREGKRIDRRNAQDIFIPLYNHQIPPGSADVIHYRFTVPRDVVPPIRVDVALRYRKFDATYMRHVYGAAETNELPVIELARDTVVFPVAGRPLASGTAAVENPPSPIPEWQRYNDYGIALLRKGGKTKGELRQAEEAFAQVEALGYGVGALNLARLYLEQGTVEQQAVAALERAGLAREPAPSWSLAWFGGLVDKQNGFLDQAIERFSALLDASTEETRRRGFDFSRDYRVLNELGVTLFERAKLERGAGADDARRALLRRASESFERALLLDPENTNAHYNLNLLYQQLGRAGDARRHLDAYLAYKPDDNARDRAVLIARRDNPAADHAAEAIVLYDLQRPGAYQDGVLPSGKRVSVADGDAATAGVGATGATGTGGGR